MRRQHGFSLVELLIAVTLGLLLLAGLIAVFVGTRASYMTTTGSSSLDDDARFSTDIIARALRSTGFVGCNEAPRVTTLLSSTDPAYDFSDPVTGYEATGTASGKTFALSAPAGDSTASDWSPSLPGGGSPTNLVGQVVKGSDVLVVHTTLTSAPPATITSINNNSGGSSSSGGGSGSSGSSSGGNASFVVGSYTGFSTGQLAEISDCAKATVFQISTLTASSDTISLSSSGLNASATFPISYGATSFMYAPTSSIFYIGVGADGDSALFRSDLTQTSTGYQMNANELVPDVENMQVLYGIDPNNQRSATEYVTADKVSSDCPGGTWDCVVSVSVAVLVASPPGVVGKGSSSFPALLGTTITPATTDTRQRQVYQFTVALRNSLP